MNAYFFMILGLTLIFLEFFMPGIILGILGVLMLLWSYVFIISEGSGPAEILFFIGGSLVALSLLIRYAIWSIPRAKKGRSIYSSGNQEGYFASSYDTSAIGKTGKVLTDLKPGGYIVIDDATHPALSVSGYLEKDTLVTVLSGEGENLIVKQKDE